MRKGWWLGVVMAVVLCGAAGWWWQRRALSRAAAPASTAQPQATAQPDAVARRTAASTAQPQATAQPDAQAGQTTDVQGDPIVLAAGDIAGCDTQGDEATAALLAGQRGTVLALGDTVYDTGAPREYRDCYGPSWGRFLARTRPAVGNHEYLTTDAAGYFDYFGAAAGQRDQGYYSYELGAWHIVVLNSNCGTVSCDAGAAQERWLRQDLAAHPAACTLAYWHHPRWSSGEHGSNTAVQPLWAALYAAGAEIVLSGHDHDYERFARQDAAGKADAEHGMRQFVVGTGGKSHYAVERQIDNSAVYSDSTFGILRLVLHPAGYDWEFLPEAGKTFRDAGHGDCHGPPGAP